MSDSNTKLLLIDDSDVCNCFFSEKGKKVIFPQHVIKGIGVFRQTQTEYSEVYIYIYI